ncbi:ester cyclase [Streptomyces sp. NPDC015345]|uniref:ester cyclase n=1 Tax=Streptomyces sp. NPDC015345 TaxID=3364953 RepID=UPI0036FB2388
MKAVAISSHSPAETVTGLLKHVWTLGQFASVPRFIHPEYRLLDERAELKLSGRQEFIEGVSAFRGLLDDPYMTATHVVVGQDTVAYRWELTGQLKDARLLTPALQVLARHLPEIRSVSVRGVNIARLEEGLLIEEWSETDHASLNEQMGHWQ